MIFPSTKSFFLLVFLAPLSFAAELQLNVSGFQTLDGKMMVSVYDNKKDWLSEQTVARATVEDLLTDESEGAEKGTDQSSDEVIDKIVSVTIELEPGDYAVTLFHDVNDNGKLDTRKLIPIPTEPIGLSNNTHSKFGPPKYKRAVFSHASEGTQLEISLQ